MKTGAFILCLCCLFSTRSFTQKLTDNYLIGTWDITDSTQNMPSMSFVFKDGMHVTLVIPDEGSVHLMYSVVKYNNQVVLRFKGTGAGNKETQMYWFIKILNNKTMEAEEPFYSPQSYKWNEDLAIIMTKQDEKTSVQSRVQAIE